jgi:hypothetical protein
MWRKETNVLKVCFLRLRARLFTSDEDKAKNLTVEQRKKIWKAMTRPQQKERIRYLWHLVRIVVRATMFITRL